MKLSLCPTRKLDKIGKYVFQSMDNGKHSMMGLETRQKKKMKQSLALLLIGEYLTVALGEKT